MEVSPSPFFVFHWIIRRKKSLLSGLKCNGFIKIALSGFRPWWHAVHSFCLNCIVFVWILYVNNYEKLNILSTFAFGYTFVIIHIWCRVDLWRYVIFFKLDEEHMHIVEVLGLCNCNVKARMKSIYFRPFWCSYFGELTTKRLSSVMRHYVPKSERMGNVSQKMSVTKTRLQGSLWLLCPPHTHYFYVIY